MKIRTLIVDDEPLARERIRTLLRDEADIQIVSECPDGATAVKAMETESPDLAFLDIQMPGLDGFGVLRAVAKERMPVVIFVTAYDQHALRAFEAHALDYLLKPFKPARFKQAVEHAREQLAQRRAGAMSQGLLELLGQTSPKREFISRVAVKIGERTQFVKAEQIDYAESAGNYVVLHVGKENHVVRETLGALEEKLDPKKFARVSRSALVNIEQIKELQPMFRGEYIVVLHNGKQIPMTRGLRELQELLTRS